MDYVTEKFFMALDMDIVPVVLGGANYSAIAPPRSFIDTKDFASPRHLAKELKRLAAAEEEYLDFFRWKSDYQVEILSFGLIEILTSRCISYFFGQIFTRWRRVVRGCRGWVATCAPP